MIIKNVRHCARCGGDHDELVARPLAQPFAPLEAAGVVWTHWVPCPSNGEPILVRSDQESEVLFGLAIIRQTTRWEGLEHMTAEAQAAADAACTWLDKLSTDQESV